MANRAEAWLPGPKTLISLVDLVTVRSMLETILSLMAIHYILHMEFNKIVRPTFQLWTISYYKKPYFVKVKDYKKSIMDYKL